MGGSASINSESVIGPSSFAMVAIEVDEELNVSSSVRRVVGEVRN